MAVAAITDHGGDIDVALRASKEQGLGWSLGLLSGQPVAHGVRTSLVALSALAPQQSLTLYVPQSSVATYQELAAEPVTVQPDDWSHWIAGAQELSRDDIDLISGLTASAAGTEFSWRRWRLPPLSA